MKYSFNLFSISETIDNARSIGTLNSARTGDSERNNFETFFRNCSNLVLVSSFNFRIELLNFVAICYKNVLKR